MLYILILTYLTLTLSQGHSSARKQKLLHQLCQKFSVSLVKIGHTVDTY